MRSIVDFQFFGDIVTKKIFVVYGYHLDEKFAIEIGRDLGQENIDNVVVKMYDGTRPEFYTPDSRREWSLRSYLRKNLPFDYAMILHDCGPKMDEVMKLEEPPPALFFIYFRKGEISQEFKTKLEDFTIVRRELYCRKKREPDHRPLCPFFHANFRDMSAKYDKIDIEYYPGFISLDDGLDFLKGLIDILKTE